MQESDLQNFYTIRVPVSLEDGAAKGFFEVPEIDLDEAYTKGVRGYTVQFRVLCPADGFLQTNTVPPSVFRDLSRGDFKVWFNSMIRRLLRESE